MQLSSLILKTSRLKLRAGQLSDAAGIADYYVRNRDHFARFEPPRTAVFYTAEFWEKQLRQYDDEFTAGLSCRTFLFLESDPDRVVGTASLTGIIRSGFQACYLGFSIDEHEQGKGLMREALSALIQYAFAPADRGLNLHRIMANHLPDNERSARLLKHLGFSIEGYAKDYLFIGNRWRDHVLNSLVNPSWLP